MSGAPTQPIGLARHEGWALYSADEAMLKGVLEADTDVELIAGPPRESFAPLLGLARDEADRKSTRLNSSHSRASRMPSSA